MTTAKTIALALFAGLTLAASARAAVILTYEAGAAAKLANGPVTVPIYLRETLTGGSASTITADGGLYSIGLRITETSGNATITGFDRNPAFDLANPGSAVTSTAAAVNAEQAKNFGNGVKPASGLVLLGTATITPGTVSSTFSIADFGAGDQIVDYAFNSLDAAVNANGLYAFTVVVPEPAALGVLAAAAGIGLRRKRRV